VGDSQREKWVDKYIKIKPKRLAFSRFVLGIVGMFIPGLLLVTDPNKWLTTQTLEKYLHVPVLFIVVLGIILVIASLFATFSHSYRDFGLIIGAIFYLIVMIGDILAFFQGVTVGVLVVTLPVLAWLYIERALSSSQIIENERHPLTKEE
jgi:CDP-diglyceride synthetase